MNNIVRSLNSRIAPNLWYNFLIKVVIQFYTYDTKGIVLKKEFRYLKPFGNSLSLNSLVQIYPFHHI